MIIRRQAYPRAGLIGNPSDGYFGRTIAFCFSNFRAEVELYESPELELLPSLRDHCRFGGIRQLTEDVHVYGYHGGLRLLKAAVKCFYEYCTEQGIVLHSRNFTIRYNSNIPHMVGLAGSSAIVTACFRALTSFYGITIPRPQLANLILAVETEELGISAGLQDRVAQVYEGLVYMNFDETLMQGQGYGQYDLLDAAQLPSLYIAYREDFSEGSEVFHNDLHDRYLRQDVDVHEAIRYWVDLTEQARSAIDAGRGQAIGKLLDDNFDRRAALCRISAGNLRMIEAARALGASAKFTGSGGAIVGTYSDDAMFDALSQKLSTMNIKVIKPTLVDVSGEKDAGS